MLWNNYNGLMNWLFIMEQRLVYYAYWDDVDVPDILFLLSLYFFLYLCIVGLIVTVGVIGEVVATRLHR